MGYTVVRCPLAFVALWNSLRASGDGVPVMDIEHEVRNLPVPLQRRMAQLVLRGWLISKQPLSPTGRSAGQFPLSWSAHLPASANSVFTHQVVFQPDITAMHLRLYSAKTLRELLDQMVGVVEEMVLAETSPDAAQCADLPPQ